MKKKYIAAIIIIAFIISIVLIMFSWFAGKTASSSHDSGKDVMTHKGDTMGGKDEMKDKMLDMETYLQMGEDDYQEADKSALVIPYKNLQLNQTKLYLKEGLQFSLRLQPDEYSKWNEIEDELAFWNMLRKEAVWESSDEDVVTVKDGVVKAVHQGEAVVTASLEESTYQCKIYVMSRDKDEAIPLQFNNGLFTKELYENVEKIKSSVWGYELEITTRYGISSVFSMLAEYSSMEELGDKSEKGYGAKGVRFVLKNGKEKYIELRDMGEVKYNGKLYELYYDPNASYGQGNRLMMELAIFGPQLGSLENL